MSKLFSLLTVAVAFAGTALDGTAVSAEPSPPVSAGQTPPARGGPPPSVAAPKTAQATPEDLNPDGGGYSLADCMGLWDRSTHMTKIEWRNTCERTVNGLVMSPRRGSSSRGDR